MSIYAPRDALNAIVRTDFDYRMFLASKAMVDPATGLKDVPALPACLFPFQRDIVAWALRRGRAALLAGTGLGKSLMELAWGQAVCEATGGMVLLFAPPAVAHQMLREADKFDIPARLVACQADCGPGINITNYQKMHHFEIGLLDTQIALMTRGITISTSAPHGTRQFLPACAKPAPEMHSASLRRHWRRAMRMTPRTSSCSFRKRATGNASSIRASRWRPWRSPSQTTMRRRWTHLPSRRSMSFDSMRTDRITSIERE